MVRPYSCAQAVSRACNGWSGVEFEAFWDLLLNPVKAFKMAAKRSSRGSAVASAIRVYLQDFLHSQFSHQFQHPAFISPFDPFPCPPLSSTNALQIHPPYIGPTNRFLVNKLPSSFVAINSYFYKFVSRDAILVFTFLRGTRAARVILLAQLAVNYHQLSRTSFAIWPCEWKSFNLP